MHSFVCLLIEAMLSRPIGVRLREQGVALVRELAIACRIQAQGGWMSEAHDRYHRYSAGEVLSIPAGMLGPCACHLKACPRAEAYFEMIFSIYTFCSRSGQ